MDEGSIKRLRDDFCGEKSSQIDSSSFELLWLTQEEWKESHFEHENLIKHLAQSVNYFVFINLIVQRSENNITKLLIDEKFKAY